MMWRAPHVALLLAGCVGAPIGPSAPAPPVLDGVDPAFGVTGIARPVIITLTGKRFVELDNVVTIRPAVRTAGTTATLRVDATRGGTKLFFLLPKCVGSGRRCVALGAGQYAITVTTPAGVSTAVAFRLCEPAAPSGCPPRRRAGRRRRS